METNKKELDPRKPAIIHYKGQNHMVMKDGNVYRVYNYFNQTLEEVICRVGEEESIRGCSGFDF